MRTNGEYGAAADAGRTRALKVVASARALGRLGVPQRILSAATLLFEPNPNKDFRMEPD